MVEGVTTRLGHRFTDEEATRTMQDEFARTDIPRRHVLVDPAGDPSAIAVLVRRRGTVET